MDLLIPDNWLKDYLKTKATPKELQKYLSLSGPTVDRINGLDKETVYEIEVTTNRPDAMSVYGIAREAATILQRNKINARLKSVKVKANQKLSKKVKYINIETTPDLCSRTSAILLKNIVIKDSPKYIQERLKQVGERPLNNVIDVSNYVMHELGQPIHVFDYDKISNHKMVMRKSKAGEKITTLDNKPYVLPKGGIIIEDGSGKLIDMPGIMGGINSAIDKNTKNVLLFVQTYDSYLIRKMAMQLDKWSNAARLFEKGLDPELVEIAIRRSIDLLVENASAIPETEILDIYIHSPKKQEVTIPNSLIKNIIGIEISQDEVLRILTPLGFKTTFNKESITIIPPSYRTKDIQIPEDIIEEIARIYGYQNIPGELMTGEIPVENIDDQFKFENKIKNILKGVGGIEVYSLSLVSKEDAGSDPLKLSNALGGDTEYLRKTLKHSLVKAANDNKHWDEPFHLFEMANVYIPQKGDLPKERMTLAGIFSAYDFREAKGVVEMLISKLNISNHDFVNKLIPLVGTRYFYYEFEVEQLNKYTKPYPTFSAIPQFPPQVEDVTLVLPFKTEIGKVMKEIMRADPRINRSQLRDIFNDSYTFRVWFQDPKKTLNNQEVSSARNKMLRKLHQKVGAKLKE